MAWFWKRKQSLVLDLPPPPQIKTLKKPGTAGVTIDLTDISNEIEKAIKDAWLSEVDRCEAQGLSIRETKRRCKRAALAAVERFRK